MIRTHGAPRCFRGLATAVLLLAGVASAVVPVGAEEAPAVFVSVPVPADWPRLRANGLDLAVPPDWTLVQERRDGRLWGEYDEGRRESVAIGYRFSDDPERDMRREDAEPIGSVVLPGGQVFRRWRAVAPEEAGTGRMEALVSDLPLRGEDRLILLFVVLNRDVAPDRARFDMFVSSLDLPPPGAQLQRDLMGGVVRIPLDASWSGETDEADPRPDLRVDDLPGRLRLSIVPLAPGIVPEGTPALPVTFLGEPARLFAHADPTETVDDGTGDGGEARLVVLETCMPDGAPVALRFSGMPAFFHDPRVAAAVSGGAIVLPRGAAPCAPGTLPGGALDRPASGLPVAAPPFGVAAPGPVPPRAEGVALGGLYTYRMPVGWSAEIDPADRMIRFTDGVSILVFARAEALVGASGLSALVPSGTPHRATISFGWPAEAFTWQDPSRPGMVSRLVVHDHCLAGEVRFGSFVSGTEDFLDGGGLSRVLREVDLVVPDEARACASALDDLEIGARRDGDPASTALAASGPATSSPSESRDPTTATAERAASPDWLGAPPPSASPSPASESMRADQAQPPSASVAAAPAAGGWDEPLAPAGDTAAPGATAPIPGALAPAAPMPAQPAPGGWAVEASSAAAIADTAPPTLPPPPPVAAAVAEPVADPDRFEPGESGYGLYVNGRYGTAISYPVDYFMPDPPPGNGDGRRFVSADGAASFVVFAQYDVEGSGLEGLIARAKADASRSVAYERFGPDWFVLSGHSGADVYYRRVELSRDGLVHTFEITYPSAMKASFDPVVTWMANSFGPTREPGAPLPAADEAGDVALPGVVVAGLRTPDRGSPERTAIIDAARPDAVAAIGHDVVFVVSVLRSDGAWAYLQGRPINADGSPIDWSRTPFAAEMRKGTMSDTYMALLVRDGGTWRALRTAFGPTDVAWLDWAGEFGLPEALFMP